MVPREPSAGMLDSAENAMIESEWAYNAGEPDARSDAHGFPTMRIWQAVVAYRAMLAAAPQPATAQQPAEEGEALVEALRELEEREQRDEALLRQALEALSRAHQTAMVHTLKARIPECAEFGGIAQDLDFVVAALRERLGEGAEP